MFVLKATLLLAAFALASSQGPTTTPVPILKQVNKQNDDGSYSFGYEAADGSFKIETKYPNGDVAGKYGYVDESGKLREISYGAGSKRGFEPQGSGINVPPPHVNDPTSHNALTEGQEDDGQYREDPSIYEDPKYNRRQPSSARQFLKPTQPEFQQSYQPQQKYQAQQNYQPQQSYQQPEPQYQQRQTYQPQPSFTSGLFSQQPNLFSQSPQQFPQERPQNQIYHQQPQFSYQSSFAPQYQQQYQPQNYQNQNYNPFVGHPAQNFDPNTGSYTIDFTG